jgi:hypothetical protein
MRGTSSCQQFALTWLLFLLLSSPSSSSSIPIYPVSPSSVPPCVLSDFPRTTCS